MKDLSKPGTMQDTMQVAKQTARETLAALKNWFRQNDKIFTEDKLYAEFFVSQNGVLKPGINFKNDLLADNKRGLKIWLGVLLTDPTQVMLNHPEIIDALTVIMKEPTAINERIPPQPVTNAPSDKKRPPVKQSAISAARIVKEAKAKPKSKTPDTRTPHLATVVRYSSLAAAIEAETKLKPQTADAETAPAIVVHYRSLAAAIEGQWGKTAAEIHRKWPSSKKPPQHELHLLASEPEKALAENSKLLSSVYQFLQPVLPLSAYPARLQERLQKLERP